MNDKERAVVSVLAGNTKWDIRIGHYIPLTDNEYQDYRKAADKMGRLAKRIVEEIKKLGK